MPTRREFPIDTLREAVAQKAAVTSVRQVAREVGISRMGLTAFLQEAKPHSRTYRKLIVWFLRERHSVPGVPDVYLAEASLELLTQHLPLSRRRKVQQNILALLTAEKPIPPWAKQRGTDSVTD